ATSLGVALVALTAAAAVAQPSPLREHRQAVRLAQRQTPEPGAAAQGEPVVSPGEIQRVVDSHPPMPAQDQMQISDDQVPQFLTRFKALQDIRRQALNQRTRRIMELRRLINAPQFDESAVREQLKGIDEIDARSQADLKKAYDAIDQVLNIRQQAK